MVEETKKTSSKLSLVGKVISNKMDKTIVVSIDRDFKHSQLKKVVRTAKKYKVHDEQGVANVGDIVEISEGRPVSKTKYMYLERVIKQSS